MSVARPLRTAGYLPGTGPTRLGLPGRAESKVAIGERMSTERQYGWMWVEACEVLNRAERLQRQFLRYMGPGVDAAVWEPPVDIQETDDGLILLFALPGVAPEAIDIRLEPDALTVSAMRPLQLVNPEAVIRRLEIPHGRFVRRIALAGAPLRIHDTRYANGCLEVRLVAPRQSGNPGREPVRE